MDQDGPAPEPGTHLGRPRVAGNCPNVRLTVACGSGMVTYTEIGGGHTS